MSVLSRVYDWLDDQIGIRSAILPVIVHPVPKDVNWWYIFGSATLTSFIIQAVTGVALAFAYVPSPNAAYDSLDYITNQAFLGSVIRGVHYFNASAMVILITIHMIRVFLMAAYKYPRQLTWLIGVFLLILTLGMAFTGQLLRWNQDAYWAVFVMAEQAARAPILGPFIARVIIAGSTVGGTTLTRFYATHVFLIPALMFGLIGAHLYLIVRNGISELPKAGQPVNPKTYKRWYDDLIHRDGIPFWPDAAWRDVVFALVVGAVVVVLAVVVGPPDLGAKADPTNLVADPRPDWYFLWLFSMLALMPRSIEDAMILIVPLALLVALLAVPFISPAGERSPRRRPWAIATVVVGLLASAVLIQRGQTATWSPNFEPQPLPAAITTGLSPTALQGAQLFQVKGCLNCHLIAGSGGLRGPDLTTVGSRLRPDQLTWRILNGGENMPAYGSALKPDELQAIVEFLSTRLK